MTVESAIIQRNSKQSAKLRPLAMAVAIAGIASSGMLLPVAAHAETAATPAPIETMLVTGTRGRERSVTNTPVPVDVISADQVQSAGAFGGEFGVALQALVPSFNFQRQSSSGTADLVRPAQLRGMSPDQTLVLINGKRRHTTSITTTEAKTGRGTAPVDFNSIPSNAISRIEVLRDGAGAQYGSDAIAGVINVRMDERPEGLDVSYTYGGHRTDFDPAGHDINDGETNAFAASYGMPLGDGGFIRFGGEHKQRAQTARGAAGDVPFFEDEGNVALVGGQRNFKPGDGKSIDRNIWVNFGTPLNDDIDWYGLTIYSERDAEGTGFYRYPISSANILSVNPLGFRPVTTGDNTDFSISSGLRGEAMDWHWDGSLSWGRNKFDAGVRNSLNPSLGATSPTSFSSGTTENSQFSVNFDVSREIGMGFALPATLAMGIEYRRENFESKAGDLLSYSAGPLADFPDFKAIGAQAGSGLRPEEERDLDRDVGALYIEVSADVTETVFVDVSARAERSDDFGSTLAGKLAARWEFTPGYAVRGAISNNFRSPSLVQIGYGTSSTSFGVGGQLTTVNTLPVDDVIARALGAQDLDEETSTNYSIGFTGELTDDMVLTVDLFRIDVDDRITLSERLTCFTPIDESDGDTGDGDGDSEASSIGIQAVAAATMQLCQDRNVTSANFFTNAVNTRTEGVDVVFTYGIETFGGALDLSAGYAYAKTEIQDVQRAADPDLILVGVEEANTIEEAAPKNKLVLSAQWHNDALSVLARVTRWGETTRVFNFGGGFEPKQTYGSEWQLDMEGSYNIFPGVQVFLGASNLLDAYPDKSIDDISYFGNLPYDVLSPVGMNGRFIYGGARVSL